MDLIVSADVHTNDLTLKEKHLRSFYYQNPDLLDPYQLWAGDVKLRMGAMLFE